MDIYGKIDAAQARIREGQAPRRIPVDSCDVDIVLYECEREIRHLRAENKALRKYANHTSDCNLSSIYQSVALRGCNCGFDALAAKEE